MALKIDGETLKCDGELKSNGEAFSAKERHLKGDRRASNCKKRGVKLKGRSGRRRSVKGRWKGLQLQRRGLRLKATRTHYCLPLAPLYSPITPPVSL